jgi:hypothetical protein
MLHLEFRLRNDDSQETVGWGRAISKIIEPFYLQTFAAKL